MADQIKELIEKIQSEGINAAQEKASAIETEAKQKADAIIRKAQSQAKAVIDDAQDKAARLESSGRAAVQQAGRDVLLTLKKEILSVLKSIIEKEIAGVLKPEDLAGIISDLVRKHGVSEGGETAVYLSEDNKRALESYFLKHLASDISKGIVLRSGPDIKAGFIISVDGGKSHFDFSDKALADYFGTFLNPAVAQILNGK